MTKTHHTKHHHPNSDITMKTGYLIVLAAFLVLLTPESVNAQVGACTTGGADEILSTNNVRARIINTGNTFWRGSPQVYTVPKADGVNAHFTGSLWVGGQVSNTLRVAGATYGSYEFWPGPVSGVVAGQDCSIYDRIYRVAERDINALDAGEQPGLDALEWPWELGAPVIDGDGNPNNYDLAAGDRPEVLGDESLFWIMNDVGNTHNRTESAPLGIEVHVTAFAASSSDTDIDNATFYRYRIINRNTLPIEDTHIGLFNDVDLGAFNDDYVGSAPALNIGYVYNGDNDDETAYGIGPPAIGYQIMSGPLADSDGLDNDNDGSTDEAGEQIGMSSYMYFGSGVGLPGDPRFGEEMYNVMRGIWKDGTPMTEGGDGYLTAGAVVKHVYPGTPGAFWSELDSDGFGNPSPLGDRRMVVGIGPFDLQPGESAEILVGVLWARGTDNVDSVSELLNAATNLQGKVAQDIVGDLAVTVLAIPEPTVPGDMAPSQPLDVTLEWIFNSGDDVQFEVQLADNDGFQNSFSVYSESTTVSLAGQLVANQDYVWRVRAFNPVTYSPWSGTFSFSTGTETFTNLSVFESFSVVENAGGLVSPPSSAAAGFRGFPGIGNPDATQQVNGSTWFIHTGGNGARPSYTEFLSRVLRFATSNPMPYDYELRFTGTTINYDRFFTGTVKPGDPLPFEVWNTGIGTPNDTSDDFRMNVAAIDWEDDGWGIRDLDHEVSGGTNDPQTDWFYIHEPVDTSPGTVGYDAWVISTATDPEAILGTEKMGRLVFVNWNGGDVNGAPPVYDAVLPESGTIFRIETNQFPAPLLSAPADDAFSTPGDVSFFWSSATQGTDRLIIATDEALTNVVSDLSNVANGVAVNLTPGTYYWQILASDGGISAIWKLNVENTSQFDVSVVASWNLLGIPYSAPDMSAEVLFGSPAGSRITTFTGQYSAPQLNQVQHGRGYWVEFPGAAVISNNVFVRSIMNVDVEAGWNMVSGPGCTIAAAVATCDTGVLVAGTQFGYSAAAYVLSSDYVAGKGYWLMADGAGTITLDCALAKGGSSGGSDFELLADFNSFVLTPADNSSHTLYFGGQLPNELSENAFTLPPLAPSQSWRAEYSDGKYVSVLQSAIVDLTSAPLPMTLERGAVDPADELRVVLYDVADGVLEESDLKAGESFLIEGTGIETMEVILLSGTSTATESDELPSVFTLTQNYPNPFNPRTTIRFALPQADQVTITVLDLTGRVVATLARGASYGAGWHEVPLDASDMASGVYFYRVATKLESHTMRMVLLK